MVIDIFSVMVVAGSVNIFTTPETDVLWKVCSRSRLISLSHNPGFEFDDTKPKTSARLEYKNILYLERPGCNLCMGNQEKAARGDTVMATSTRLFQGRVVEDSERKKGESLLASTPVVVLSAILGRIPSMEEYETAVEGINLTKFAPPLKAMYN